MQIEKCLDEFNIFSYDIQKPGEVGINLIVVREKKSLFASIKVQIGINLV